MIAYSPASFFIFFYFYRYRINRDKNRKERKKNHVTNLLNGNQNRDY